jgi:hypothetical protein
MDIGKMTLDDIREVAAIATALTQPVDPESEIHRYGGAYRIVRTRSAGVFVGDLQTRTGDECVMTSARRLWYWSGAASLSQLAIDGPGNPGNCKFPAPVPRVELLGVIEILDVSDKARAAIEAVPIWQS